MQIDTKRLFQLIRNMPVFEAPHKTERAGKYFEFLVGIGTDYTAKITMEAKAYELLQKMGKQEEEKNARK